MNVPFSSPSFQSDGGPSYVEQSEAGNRYVAATGHGFGDDGDEQDAGVVVVDTLLLVSPKTNFNNSPRNLCRGLLVG